MVTKNPEIRWNYENPGLEPLKSELSDLNDEVIQSGDVSNPEETKDWWDNTEEKREKSFTFKPIAISVWKSRIKNWEERNNNTTTTVEFAWWWKNLNLYGYTRKDWNNYTTWFDQGIELFANENLKLGNNFDINGKQFYWWEWNGRLMVWPHVSTNKQFWNVWVWWSIGAYWTYDAKSWSKDTFTWSSVVSVNFSVKWKNWKTWNWDAFLNISNIKNLHTSEYGTYGEANLQTPNLLDPKAAGALCWMLYARYWWNIKDIKLSYLWVGLKYEF